MTITVPGVAVMLMDWVIVRLKAIHVFKSHYRVQNQGCGEPLAHEAHRRSFVKAVSWRMTGTLDTFIISLIVTDKAAIAGSIAATELLTKIALYYGHERAWAAVQWGRR
jgi:uncharacterized membrane protein